MTNLPAERPESLLALTGAQASLFDDDPRRLLGLDDGEFAALVADVRQSGESVIVRIRQVVGLLAWAAWHRYDEKRYREFVADFAGRLGVESRVILDWRRKAAKGLPMPAIAQARSDARKGAGQRPVNTSGRIIPAASTEAPAKSSEGEGNNGVERFTPRGPTPSGPSSGGARTTAPPVAPTDEADPSLRPAPLDPSDRPPSRRQQASAIVAAFQDAEDGVGRGWTHEEATYLFARFRAERDAWATYNKASIEWADAPPAPAEKPQRRQGTITRPPVEYDRRNPASAAGAVDGSLTRPMALSGVSGPNGSHSGVRAKRHADDCRCLSCATPKAAAK